MNGIILKQISQQNLPTSLRYCSWTKLASAFNTRPHHKINLNTSKDTAGLFNVPELQSHEGFHYLQDDCITKTDQLIDEAINKARSRKMVEIFDDLSNTLCKVADLAEFVRIAHPSVFYTQAAEVASGTVSSIVEKLNTNKQLYSALLDIVQNGDKTETNDVDHHVAKLFLLDSELSGIHLPEEERNKVVSLNDSVLHLGQQFVAGSTNPRVIKKNLLPENARKYFRVEKDDVVVSSLYLDSSNPRVRELSYRIFLYPDDHQEYVLTELLKARHTLAEVCGFETYAQRALKGSTLENPEMVMDFLNKLSDGLKPRAEEDFRFMDTMKQSEYKYYNEPLQIWDTVLFTKKARKQLFSVQNSEYSQYFSLGTCMEGINNLLVKLYGISLVIQQTEPGECWTRDVYKIGVLHETEGVLGYIYCDFYERPGKPNQECHFTIRGGKVLPDGSYQLPLVVLMLNLPLPRWSRPTLLSPEMLDNLFHEMGHAMHSMLGRTRYQHVSGTRCSTDFAEVPSILMEYFSNDIRVLRTFAKHFQTLEPMPEHMLRRLCASKRLFMASGMQMQVFYSALDQIYHGNHPLVGSTTQVLAETQKRYYGLPYVENTAFQLRFCHLVGYGAKYYSYLVSRALASCIWQTYFEKDPLNREQGERYHYECLAHGGGKPSRQLVTDFLKKQPSTDLLVECLLKEIDADSKQKKITFTSE